MTLWKKKQKILKIKRFIKGFHLSIKQCYRIAWSAEEIQKVKVPKTWRITLLSKYEVCDNKKSKFIKEQEASGLLISLVRNGPLSKIPLLGHLLF